MPQMIHYIAADQEPGVDWSPMPLHMHTSTAQLPPPPSLLPPPAQDTRDLYVESWAQPLMSEMTQSRDLKHSAELLNAGKHGGTCFHASANMFSPTILTRVSQKVQNGVGRFQNFGRRNVFNSTASLFKRGVSFPPHPLKPTWVQHVDMFVFYSLWGSASFRGTRGNLRLARKWWDGDKYPALPGINSTKCNHSRAARGSHWTSKQNKKRRPGQETRYLFHAPRLFAYHLLDMIITTRQGIRG